ncbi:hypothetical protein [Cytobacillus purgationiresistens]|uniref:Uncharacterized protein n=1 Tax=Cytobacillus purgationiresistens TaxID=863449 RepID=A0ABU0ALP9_9BACI|nr:hypothetical protein [Cytobacillus purgationiresistens]MDQ0272191.1 hypothetical protein [Cytobacillus purgationiresistens]
MNYVNEKDAKYVLGKTGDGQVIKSSINPMAVSLFSTGNSSGRMSATYGGYTTATSFIKVDGAISA